MSYTKVRDAAPPARSAATLEAERHFYAHFGNRTAAQTPASLKAVDREQSRLGGSSSVMVPVLGSTGQQPATQQQFPTTRHHPRYLPAAAMRRKPVDGEAAVAVFIALALYVVLVVLLIATSSRPSPVRHVNETTFGRPLATKSATSEFASAPVTPVAPDAPILPIEAAKPIAPPPLEAIAPKAAPLPTSNAALKASAVARREKALDLLKRARESQNDAIVYRQMLAELVRSYGDTPAGAEALNLLVTAEPSNAVTPPAAETREEEPVAKQPDEKPTPKVHYGLGLMD